MIKIRVKMMNFEKNKNLKAFSEEGGVADDSSLMGDDGGKGKGKNAGEVDDGGFKKGDLEANMDGERAGNPGNAPLSNNFI